MENHFQKLADDVGTSTVNMCAMIAEMHHIRYAESDFEQGYNAAIEEIAAKIRKIKKKEA